MAAQRAKELADMPSKADRDATVARIEKIVEAARKEGLDGEVLLRALNEARRVAAIVIPTPLPPPMPAAALPFDPPLAELPPSNPPKLVATPAPAPSAETAAQGG